MNKDLFYCPALNTKWNLYPNKYIFYAHSKKVGKSFIDYQLLSLTKAGVIKKDINSNEGKLPESFENYQTVECNDMILCLFDLDVSAVFSGISNYDGMITSAYDVFGINRNLAIPKFIDYWFSNIFTNRSYCVFSKSLRHTITWDIFKKLPTALPPLPIQNKIVEILDDKIVKIDALIEIENKQIEKLDEYKKAVITRAVTKGLDPNVKMKDSGVEWIGEIPEGWKIEPLKAHFLFNKGLPITKENLIEDGIKVISYGQIHAKYNRCTFITDELYRYVSSTYLNTNPECLVNKGDFIVADTSEDVEGTGDFIHIDKNDLIFAGYHCIVLRNFENIYSKYIAYLFMSDVWRNQVRCKVSGVKLFSLTQKILSSTQILIPNQNEQQQIADYLDHKNEKINRIIEIKKSKIEKLQAYKKSLIYEYVTGKKEVVL